MTNFMRYLNIDTTLTPAATVGTVSKNVLLCGQRITNGELIRSTNGFTQPNYYVPILLPSFQNGISALTYLANYGIQYTMGINFSLSLPAPDNVVVVGSVTQVSWDVVPANFDTLLGFVLSGTLSQLSVNAQVRGAELIAGVATITVTGSPAFVESGDSGAAMTLAGLNNIPYPDPNLSDPIALMVWDFYQTYLSANNSANGSPTAYISILGDRDESVNPSSTPLTFANPSAVSSNVGNAQTLTYPIAAANLGYLPTTAFGTTSVSQSIAYPTNSTNFVYYANGMFIRGSAAGAGLTYSLNGISWTATNVTTGTFTSAFYNGTRFVATSAAGIYSSTDGITWAVTNINSGSFNSVYFNDGVWVALSTVGIYYSANGTVWTITTGAATGVFNQAAFGNETWVATSTVDLYSSVDGITWNALGLSSDGFDAITYADGLFIAGSDGSGTEGIYYSTDGADFIATNITSNSYSSIFYNGQDWVAASDGGIYYSANGIEWTLATGTSTHNYNNVIYANSIWVAASDAGLYSSTDSITWSVTNIFTGTYNSIAYGDSLFIAVGTTGVSASANGTVWSVNATATATYNGYQIQGSNVIISLVNTTATFTTTNAVTITLDNTQSVFNFLDGIDLRAGVLQFPINTLNDVEVDQATFFDGITLLNEPNQVLNGHYFTYGMAGNITLLPSQAATLPSPNNNKYILTSYPYVYKFGDVPYENTVGNVASGRIASAVAYMFANGDAPFPALTTATINHLPVSSVYTTTSYSAAVNGTGNIAVEQGWLPLAPNSQQFVSFLQSVTTMITLPSTTVPDTEFRYTHIWDCVRYLKYQVAQLFLQISVLPNNQGTANISPQFIRQFRTGIISILNVAQNLGIIQNLEQYQNLVRVIADPEDPNQVDVYVPAQIIPQLNGANVEINIFSALYNFNTTNQ